MGYLYVDEQFPLLVVQMIRDFGHNVLTVQQAENWGDSDAEVLAGVADLRYESSCVGFLKPRPKLTFGWVQGCHSYLDSATPKWGSSDIQSKILNLS
jgi:hypothetical protein